ncbi:MAG: rod shape-determining protein MreD [Lachnospiraceae bacterium]
MKRKVVTFLTILVCFILECTVFKSLAFASVTPNLLIVVTAAFGFMRGEKEGVIVGFVAGLLLDIFYSDLVGFYGLVYAVIGFGNGMFRRLFYEDDIKLPLILISASEFIYGLIVYFFLFMMRSSFDFFYYLSHIIIPELVYTIVVTLGLYQLILYINRRLEAGEKRSASKFV